jgi:hypothetical protein
MYREFTASAISYSRIGANQIIQYHLDRHGRVREAYILDLLTEWEAEALTAEEQTKLVHWYGWYGKRNEEESVRYQEDSVRWMEEKMQREWEMEEGSREWDRKRSEREWQRTKRCWIFLFFLVAIIILSNLF